MKPIRFLLGFIIFFFFILIFLSMPSYWKNDLFIFFLVLLVLWIFLSYVFD